MKIDMGPEAIAKRLKVVNELRTTCLSLANSSAGKEIQNKFFANKAVLQDSTSYENMLNSIGILKLISQGDADIRKGKVKRQDDVFNGIEVNLNEKLK